MGYVLILETRRKPQSLASIHSGLSVCFRFEWKTREIVHHGEERAIDACIRLAESALSVTAELEFQAVRRFNPSRGKMS